MLKKILTTLAIVGTFFFFTPTKYAYATANPFDAATSSATTPLTHAASASASVAVAYIVTSGTNCTATYGGVSMKLAIEADNLDTGGTNWFGFYLAGIPTGSQSVAWSCTGATPRLSVMTYTGGPYSAWPESTASGHKDNGVGTTLNVPLRTVADNVIGTSYGQNGGVDFAPAASGMTFRVSPSIASRGQDNTNLFTPAGTLNMAWDNHGNTTNIESLAIGIANATSTAAPSFKFWQFFDF